MFGLAVAGAHAQCPSPNPGLGGANVHSDGVTFRVWAPNATTVSVAGTFNGWSTTATPLCQEGSTGYWSRHVTTAVAGNQYKFVINGSIWRKDPRGRAVTFSGGFGNNSIIVNPATFNWGAATATRPPLQDSVIYEIHIGTFNDPNGAANPPGNFDNAIARLDDLVDLGVNILKVMPVSEFPGDYSWGYNPSDPYTVESGAYGGPEGFRRFVRAAHERGLAVVLDIVHNHYGPTDLDLWMFDGTQIYFPTEANLAGTPWGDTRPDYRRPEVRDYIKDSIRLWLDEYRVDGFRWDATVYMRKIEGPEPSTDYPEGITLLREINEMMIAEYPGRYRIAEDHQSNPFVTNPPNVGGLGFDADWWSSFFWQTMGVVTAGSDNDRSMNTVRNAVQGANFRGVIYSESHDEAGNAGTARMPTRIDGANPTGFFARKRTHLAAVLTMTAPGAPMIFMGQELLMTGMWGDQVPLDWNRKTTQSGTWNTYRDLVRLRRNLDGVSAGLTGPSLNFYHTNDTAKVVAYHRWREGSPASDDVLVIANFRNQTWTNYDVGAPLSGRWYVHYNGDDPAYGSDFTGVGPEYVDTVASPMDGLGHRITVSVGPYSALILSRLPPAEQSVAFDGWMVLGE